MSCSNPDLRYLQHTPAGAQYVRQITAQESDRGTRAAFRDLVLHIAPPGGALFDFGAGPGIDARFFAEHGFSVEAYDVDPRMREFFAEHCRDLIDAGRITLDSRAYRSFLTQRPADDGRTDLVVSNFAPLNLVDDLHELFARFHTLTVPRGRVLANVLSPWYLDELRQPAWWRAALRLWRDGELFMPGPQAPYYRRLLRHFRKVSTPYFRLSRVFPGAPASQEGQPRGTDPNRSLTWLRLAQCRYMFLLFEKID